MQFKQFGRSCQLDLTSATALDDILCLDESLWAATSAPIAALRSDATFLARLDKDGNGRINTRDVSEALRWTLARLRHPQSLRAGTATLSLAQIEATTPEGGALLNSARYILSTAGLPEADSIDLTQTRAFLAELDQQAQNGDGIVIAAAAKEPETAAFIEAMVACSGGIPDAGGAAGVSAELCRSLCEGARTFDAWQAELEDPALRDTLLTLGPDTAERHAVYATHAAQIDRFFTVCGALEFSAPIAEPMAKPCPPGPEIDLSRPADMQGYLGAQLIATPTADGTLPLTMSHLNPAYRDWVQALRERVLSAVAPEAPESLTPALWQAVKRALAPYGAYLARRPETAAANLSPEQRACYADPLWCARVEALAAADSKVAQIRAQACELEKLLLFQVHLFRLLNNFVNFSQLYAPTERALFEMGSAVIDGRWFNLAFRVADPKAHLPIAKGSNLFILYLEVTAHDGTPAYTVAVPATSGSKGNLSIGKRGVFFDVDGEEFDARVVQLLENPISVREALVAPFTRLWSFILGRIESISTASEKALQQNADALLTPPPAATPAAPSASAGMLMGLSVSVAAVGSAFAFITKTLTALHPYQVAAGIVGAGLVVMVPVTLIAILKLNRQDLSSLLEAGGWAVNARMRPSREQRRQFTRTVPYPLNATGTPRSMLLRNVLIVLLACLALGYACHHLPRVLCPQ